jgi:hypothetical protein
MNQDRSNQATGTAGPGCVGANAGEREQQTNPHGKVQNKRLIQQSKYNEVLRKNKAIPEVGTTRQQMRKQYDAQLSDDQIQKLLRGNQIVQNHVGHSSCGFRQSRDRLRNKNIGW